MVNLREDLKDVEQYWNRHLNCTQFLARSGTDDFEIGSEEFFSELEQTFRRFPYKDRLFRNLLRVSSGRRVLEVGCGLGIELGKLSRLGFEVTGVDLAPRAVDIANQYLESRKLDGKVEVGNAEALKYSDESFDAVYSSGVLHHTPDISKAIGEIWRVLKPGGRVLIVLYHRRSWFYLLYRLSDTHIEFEDKDAPIINAYSETELKSLFTAFRNVSIEFEYYRPNRTDRRGIMAGCYNNVFVPLMHVAPKLLVQRFGWHAVVTAAK